MTGSPDSVPAINDPGDDIANRYHFQWAYAAIICCMLLDDASDVKEIFCEHHEDILIKHHNEKYSGLQIKTRQTDQPAWKMSDEGVLSSFRRFSFLENAFPDYFRKYLFLTNHPLHTAGNNKDIRYFLETIRVAPALVDLSSAILTVVKGLAKSSGCAENIVFNALRKTYAFDDLPKLADIEIRLVKTLTENWVHAAECTYSSVTTAAEHLILACQRASTLAHLGLLPAYLPVMDHAIAIELAARIDGKRMDQSRVLAILNLALEERAILDADPDSVVKPGSGLTSLLHKKLDAGGFSAVSLNSAEDLRSKADYLGLVWIQKHGKEKGLSRYSHIKSLVLNDAARSFESTKSANQQFGINMLSELRSRFRQRRVDESQLFECSDEHLEGFAYSLTSECKVQWSINRPWEEQ